MPTPSNSAAYVLRLAREQKGLSVGQLAYLTNYKADTIYKWEEGKRTIAADAFIRLIQAIGGKVTVTI